MHHCTLDIFTRQTIFRLLLHQVAARFLGLTLLILALQGLHQNFITRLNVILGQQLCALRMDHAEFQKRRALNLTTGGLVFSFSQSGQ